MNIGSTRKKNLHDTSVREFLDEVEMRRPPSLWAALFYGYRFQNENGESQMDTCIHPSFLTSDAVWTAAFMMLLPSSLLHNQLLVFELEAKCKWYFCHETPKKVFDKEDIPHNPSSASKLSEASGKIDIFQKLTRHQPPPLWSFSYLEIHWEGQ